MPLLYANVDHFCSPEVPLGCIQEQQRLSELYKRY